MLSSHIACPPDRFSPISCQLLQWRKHLSSEAGSTKGGSLEVSHDSVSIRSALTDDGNEEDQHFHISVNYKALTNLMRGSQIEEVYL